MDGLLLIDKPPACTSHDVVARVRKILKMSAVGHSGTLDPLASGLMVLLLGQATKLSNYILAQDKRYAVKIRFGVTTDSGDRDGVTLATQDVSFSASQLQAALEQSMGEHEWPVPMVSAVKVQGKRLYEYARQEQPVTPPHKLMRFYDLSVGSWNAPFLEAEVACSKGSYVRAWSTQLGAVLGVGASVEELRRIESLPYHVHEALTLERLQQLWSADSVPQSLGPAFVPMAEALPGWFTCFVRGREEQLLRHGQISHELGNRLIVQQKDAFLGQKAVGIKVLGEGGRLVGLLEAIPQTGLKIRRIFAAQGS